MQGLIAVLLALLVVAALAVSASQKLLPAVIIFMSYSLVMSMVWMLLKAPDLAITEAAVGAGITSVLLFIALKRIRELERNLLESEEEVREYFAAKDREEQDRE
jgi:uncharacterized MnhB-related membrane protein